MCSCNSSSIGHNVGLCVGPSATIEFQKHIAVSCSRSSNSMIKIYVDNVKYRWTAYSYPPAYPGCHGLCLLVLNSDTLNSVCSSLSYHG